MDPLHATIEEFAAEGLECPFRHALLSGNRNVSGSTGHLLLAALLVNREQDFLRFVDPCCEVC